MLRLTRRGMLAAIALFIAGAPAAQAQDALPSAAELIDRHVQAIGGREAVLSKEGARSAGQFSMPAAGIEGTIEVLTASSPTRVISRVEIPGLGTILNGYTGDIGWSVDPNLGPRLLDGMELAAMVEGSAREAAVRDASLFDVRETVEQAEMDGESCYKVRLVWKSGRETFDCYSTDTGLLIGTISNQESPMGTVEAVTLIGDYEEIDGVLTATRMTQQVLGQEQVFTLDEVEYGPIDAAEFDPPAAIQTLIEQQETEGAGR